MKHFAIAFLFASLLASAELSADGPSSMPVKQWLAKTHRVLAAASLNSPYTESERRWEALDQCVPDRPVEMRAIIESVIWKDGVAKVTIKRPRDWPATTRLTPPAIFHENTFYVMATAEQATRMKGAWFICQGTWFLLRDFRDVLKESTKRKSSVPAV